MQGAQTLPLSMLDDPRQPYTFPDINENRLAFLTAKGSLFLRDEILLGANAYFRRLRTTNFSSNVNDQFGEVDSETGLPQSNEATNDRLLSEQQSLGVGTQLTVSRPVDGRRNQFILGFTGDFGRTHFTQFSQPANFTAERGTIATGPFVTETDLDLRNAYLGLYAANTHALAEAWTLTLAGRYNHAHIAISDRSGEDPALNGTHNFARFNPAIGLNLNPSSAWTAYAGYTEGMRAPSPIELTCADPSAPCKLPNQFLADPPLESVRSRSGDVGARGRFGAASSWSFALFRTDLRNDIQFIASGIGATNAGFFQNVGNTRREGAELDLRTRAGHWVVELYYNHLDATFRSRFTASSPNNSSADARGAITVEPGNRIPGIPGDSAKLRMAHTQDDLLAAINVVYASSQFALGDENNRDDHGRLPAYTVVNLDASYSPRPRLQFFVQVANLFDRRYQNFGLLGANFFTGPDRSFGPTQGVAAVPEQFRASGSPRAIAIGMNCQL
jgi:outer membrane receptor protein involved in Fe transport